EMLYDGIKKPMVPEKRSMEFYRFNHSLKISSKNFLNNMVYVSFNSLWFGWHGMIDFRYLKSIKLKFLNQVLHEDHYFGKLLFVQSKYIYVLSKKLIHYRIRQNSIMNYDNSNNSYIPEYMLDEYNALGGNYVLYKKYHRHSSLFLTAMMVLVFLEENDFSNKKIFKKIFVKKLENWITDLANLNNTYLDKIIYFSFKRFVQLYKNHSKIQNESKCYELFFKLGYKIVQQQVILNSINGKNQ
ncbi:TPA: glycosyltransferase family 2 protein, partial [Campylobacter coli]|nr:glycosyltransferase family 2 protein [Campylobacter coli]